MPGPQKFNNQIINDIRSLEGIHHAEKLLSTNLKSLFIQKQIHLKDTNDQTYLILEICYDILQEAKLKDSLIKYIEFISILSQEFNEKQNRTREELIWKQFHLHFPLLTLDNKSLAPRGSKALFYGLMAKLDELTAARKTNFFKTNSYQTR